MNILRKWIRLVEANEPDDFGDDDDSRYDHFASSAIIKPCLPAICAAAQQVYDAWDQSDPDNDELNGGGVCHLIADEIATILNRAGGRVTTQTASHEQHVYCVGQFSDGIFEIDIHHSWYERGGGFTWYKRPGVTFTPDMVGVSLLSHDPGQMDQFVDEWEEDYE